MAKDFRKKNFGKTIRGYSPEEVDEYLAYVNEEYAKAEHRAHDFERKMVLALKKLDELSSEKTDEDAKKQEAAAAHEAAVREAEAIVAEAQSVAEEIKKAAEKDADAKISEAKANAEKIIEEARAEAAKSSEKAAVMYNTAAQMYDEVCAFRDQLFLQYNSHIEAIEGISAAAKEYIERVDGGYSEAAGEAISHEDVTVLDMDEYEAEENAPEVLEKIIPSEIEPEKEDAVRDIYIDLEDEFDEDIDDFQESPLYDDEAVADDGAVSRVLRLSALSEAIIEEENEYGLDGYSDGGYDEDYHDEEYDESEETPEDFEEISRSFREMDTLFNSDKKKDLSLTDEFDIVFSGADTGRNIEEIRRQPIVAADSNTNRKKHKNY